MIRSTLVTTMGLALLVSPSPATAEEAKPTLTASAEVSAEIKVEVSDEEALQEDILLVIDLPIAIADARDAGVEEEELTAVVETATESGVSAATTAQIVLAETETTKEKGNRKGLHLFIRKELAAGSTPQEIADKIAAREEIIDELSDEEKEKYKARAAELRAQHKARRMALAAKRKELVAQGQVIKILAHEAHKKRKAELVARKAELKAARAEHKAAHKEAREDHKEAIADHKEAREALKDAETPEERKAAAEDLKAAREDRKEAAKEHKAAAKEHKAAAKDVKDKKDDKAAKGDKAKGGPGGKKGKG